VRLEKSSHPIILRKTIYLRCLARLREKGIGTVSVRGAGEDVISVPGL
jgi:hypothetical protein